MKKIISVLILVAFLFLPGCRTNAPANEVQEPPATQSGRFEVIYEHGRTKNMGGFSVIGDKETGTEYLVVTGLNGAVAVTPLQTRQPVPGGK